MLEYVKELLPRFSDPIFLIAQIIGLIPLILGWFVFRAKSRKTTILLKATADGLSVIHFFMLSQWTGSVINVINTFRDVIFAQKGRFRWASGIYLPILFCCVTVGSSLFSWTGPESLLPMTGSCLAVIGYWQTNPKHLRRFNFAGIFLWFVYGILVFSLSAIIGNIIYMTSIITTEIRTAKEEKKKEL